MLFVFAISPIKSAAQDFDYKVGETIYVNAYYAGCVKATVKQIDPKYYVHIEEGSHKDTDVFYSAGRINECPQKSAETKHTPPPDNQPVNDPPANTPRQNGGSLNVGDRVDVYLSGNQEGKNRGTILEINASQYKVRYDGCSEKTDVWENSMLIHPAATIPASDAQIKFLNGKWSMSTVAVNADAYGTTAAWGRSPGIQINGDGSYIWYQGEGKTLVEGKWTTHAKIEGARFGTETQNGILITDAKGYGWKIYRCKSTPDNSDHITAQLMCSGETQMGTRVQ